MWRHVAASVLGFALGAFALDRVVRHRHGKNYNKWIKEDFDLQWSVIQIVGLARAFSPFSKTIQQVSPRFGALYEAASAAEKGPVLQVAGLAYGTSNGDSGADGERRRA
jgi:hypothetical protein